MTERTLFARKATGLVRPLGAADSLWINMAGVCVPVMITYVLTLGQEIWGAGSFLLLAALPGLAISAGIGIVYSFLSGAMPRSGGDYIWVSRILRPAVLGFVVNFILANVAILYNSFNVGSIIPNLFIIPWFNAMAIALNNPGLVSAANWYSIPLNQAMVGTILLFILILPMFKSTKLSVKYIFGIGFILAGFSALLLTILGYMTPHATVVANFNQLVASGGGNVTYDDIPKIAQSLGWTPGWNWDITFLAGAWGIQLWAGFNFASYAAGEVKEAGRNLTIGILGSIAVMGILVYAASLAMYNAFGFDWLNAAIWLYSHYPSSYPLPSPPYNLYLQIFMTRDPTINFLIGIGWLAQIPAWVMSGYLVFSRCVLGWSFDRVFPTRLSNVHPKWSTPVAALLFSWVVCTVFLYLDIFTPLLAWLVNILMMMYFAWFIVGLVAILFPYLKTTKPIFEAAPSIVKMRIAGIPVLVIAGVIMSVGSLWGEASCLLSPAVGGVITYTSLGAGLGYLGLFPILIYFTSKFYWKSKGVDFNLIFKQIPPE